MQNTTGLYNSIVASENHYYTAKLVIDGVGTFEENTIFEITTDSELFSGSPEIGKAIAAELNVKLLNPDVDIPKMACLRPYVMVSGYVHQPTTVTIVDPNLRTTYASVSGTRVTFNNQSGASVSGTDLRFPVSDTESFAESEWIPQGVFYIDTREITRNDDGLDVLTIHAYDAMLKAEQMFTSQNILDDSKDTEMTAEIASAIGVEVDERTYAVMNGRYKLFLPLSYTFREILGYIASMYFGCFVITEEGKLRLISLLELPVETSYLVDSNWNTITFGGTRIILEGGE